MTTVTATTQGNEDNEVGGYEGEVVAGVLSVVILLVIAVSIGICYKYNKLKRVSGVTTATDNKLGIDGSW